MKKDQQKDYHNYSANEFVLDEFFYAWVVKKNDQATSFWEQWLIDHPEKRTEIEQARNVLKYISFSQYTLPNDEVTELWSRIKSYEPPHNVERNVRSVRWRWFKAAAVIICIALFGVWISQRSERFITYNTAFGETKVVVLPDSSTVKLNSNSTLKFTADWDTHSVREVWIEGEGFFSVVHKTNNQPFRVHTDDGLAVEVLGTTFNVYSRTAETKVVLNSGKIRLSMADDSKQIEMKPGDLVEYKQKSYSTRKVNPENYSAWTDNKLILEHTSLRDMIALLRNNYGLEVRVSSESLLNQTVSGSMPMGEGTDMIEQIALAFQLRVIKEDNHYLMYE